MKIDSQIVRDYLAGKSIADYRGAWFFQKCRSFTEPSYSAEERERAETVYRALLPAAETFRPLNRAVWDTLFPGWPGALEEACVDLVIGFPQPYDAMAMRDGAGGYHVIFDLLCWTAYLGKADLGDIARNLLTHELCHMLIGRNTAGIDDDLNSGAYPDMLDAITFHEGFAHLVSYGGKELEDTDWTAPELQRVREASREELRRALAAGDEAERAAYLSRANCGKYYEKFACMAGMLYLAGQWRQGGTAALAEQFRAGYHGFAERCAG